PREARPLAERRTWVPGANPIAFLAPQRNSDRKSFPISIVHRGDDCMSHDKDWTRPQAMAIPKEGYFELKKGNYGPIFPRTPACYGFTIIAKLKAGREPAMREYAARVEKAVQGDPAFLASLKLHYLKWVLFDIGKETYFMYQGIFDTDFDKYTDDAVAIFVK